MLKGETEVTSLEQSAPGAILASQISSIEPFETEADSNGNAKPGTSSKSMYSTNVIKTRPKVGLSVLESATT